MTSINPATSNGTGTGSGHHTKGPGLSCDNCRLRKVRCSREQPCGQCAHLDLRCLYTQAPRKRANPVRGRLIAQARGHSSGGAFQHQQQQQKQQELAAAAAATGAGNGQGPGNGIGTGFGAISGAGSHQSPAASGGSNGSSSHYQHHYGGGIADDHDAGDAAHWSPRTNHSGAGHDFQPDFFLNLLDDFEQVVFPFSPIITSGEITDIIRTNMSHGLEDEALIYAYAAVTTYLSNTHAESHHYPHEKKDHLNTLLQLGLRAYRQIDLGDPRALKDTIYSSTLSSTLKRIITCIFIEISMMAFKSYDRSFSLLREQVCMIQMIETNRRLQPRDVFPAVYSSARYQRIYWEVFIHERFLSINVGYPSILPPLVIGLPAPDPAIPVYIDVSFRRLIHLFLILDEDFLAHWQEMQQQQNGTSHHHDGSALGGSKSPPMLTPQWIEAKQLQLDEDEHQAAQAEAELSQRMLSSSSPMITASSLSPSSSSPAAAAAAAAAMAHPHQHQHHQYHHHHHHQHSNSNNSNINNIHHPNTSSSSSAHSRDEAIRALQHIDQYVTRLWLRTLLWQLALSRGLLSSDPSPHSHEGLSLHFPARRLSLQLRSLVNRLDSFAAINTQGTGVLQKLFEVTSTIADVMALPSPATGDPSSGTLGASVGPNHSGTGNGRMDVDLMMMTTTTRPAAAAGAGSPIPGGGHTPDNNGGEGGPENYRNLSTRQGQGQGQEGERAAAGAEEDERATRMRDFVTLVRFLLRFDRVRAEQREYLEEKLRSLDELYRSEAEASYSRQQQQQQLRHYEGRGF
ncbi:uncharacterized protein B0I36DRAFT_363599 [Microdochium trichocladiopsis]|uniref:Zn(2)-C6 fungal-type domain-containing protein n=1 Tax=Microdochium trichocladiopsis TaxID=1682393 RepID=A0A9P8Y4P5_9PEZI|nr:uncharacterized protein B0I36DRAFT_363599 [Microdochium trichocladiopsis]KAH7028995.1 hypothetical protein B0I36DRAFT_363599 [Microdochium trichocladiopsis]